MREYGGVLMVELLAIQVVSAAAALGVSAHLAQALCTTAAAAGAKSYSRAALPLALHAACTVAGRIAPPPFPPPHLTHNPSSWRGDALVSVLYMESATLLSTILTIHILKIFCQPFRLGIRLPST